MVTGMILTILSIPVTGIKLVKKLFAFSSVLFFSMHDVNAGEKEVNAAWSDQDAEYRVLDPRCKMLGARSRTHSP